MIEVREAWERIAALAAPLAGERVAVPEAAGRILAEDVRGRVDLPGFDRSSMDGWAVRAADLTARATELPVRGDVAAGSAGDVALEPGSALRISTGAPLPGGADAILRLEDGSEADGVLRTATRVVPGTYVRRRGEDVRAGEVLLAAGARLTPPRLAVVASAGVDAVLVHRRPRVAVLATGSELVPLGEPLPPGAIHDSNGPTIAAHARADGAVVLGPGRVEDDPERTRAALADALGDADVLLVTGGVSVGGHDLVKATLAELGVRELFWRVRIKPGRPIFCGRRGDAWVFGLPGNPLSTIVGYLVFVAPLLRRLAGERDAAVTTTTVELAEDARNGGERTTYATARLRDGRAVLTEKQGSHMTKALADADGFAILPHDRDVLRAGERVEFLPLPA